MFLTDIDKLYHEKMLLNICQGFTYSGCTNVSDEKGLSWCATKVDEEGKYISFSDNFGHCQSSCPHQDTK